MKNEKIDAEVGRRLSYWRKKRNMTVQEATRITGISRDAMYAYESGRRQLTAPSLLKLANLYGVSIDDLMGAKCTSNRENAVSFELFRGGGKGRIVVSAERDDVVFYEADEWNLEYYVRSNEFAFGKRLLGELDGRAFPMVVSYDEEKRLCAVRSLADDSVRIMSRTELRERLVVLGEYAGRIEKQKQIPEFL